MSAKHTPGPWKTLPEECDKPYIRVRGTALGLRYKIANVLTPVYEGVDDREAIQTRANAQLIAAAPEMLEALRLLTSADPLIAKATDAELEAALEDEDKEVRDQANAFLVARAVIAKATGGTP